MIIEIKRVTEEEVERATEILTAEGFEYDRDFTTLYAGAYDVVGIRVLDTPDQLRIVNRLATEIDR